MTVNNIKIVISTCILMKLQLLSSAFSNKKYIAFQFNSYKYHTRDFGKILKVTSNKRCRFKACNDSLEKLRLKSTPRCDHDYYLCVNLWFTYINWNCSQRTFRTISALSWQRSLSCRNQSIDLQSKSTN